MVFDLARRPGRLALVLSIVPATGCVGSCSGTPAGSAGESPDVAVEAASVRAPPADASARRPPRPMRQGFIGLVFRAGREAPLRPEQEDRIADIQDKLLQEEPRLTALADYQTDLVAQIRAGKLDPARLDADYAAIDKTLAAREAKQADALAQLHDALDAPARAALVGAARARLEAMFRSRPELRDAGVGEAGEPLWIKHRLNRVRAELGLDEAQQARVAPLIARLGVSPPVAEATKDRVRDHAASLLDAFEKDDLDAGALDLSQTGGKVSPHAALERETKLVALLLPLLTAEQREKLATIRQRRALGHWTADIDPWSPLDDPMEHAGHPAR